MQPTSNQTQDGSIDLFELLRTLWQGRWAIVVLTVVCTGAGVAYALLATEWFRADVSMVQADSKSLSGSLGQLGGLASLAGINIGGGGASQTPIAVLKSRDFAREFIEDNHLTTVLLADQWDAAAGRWKNSDPKKQPDIRDAVEYFDKKVRLVAEDKKTSVITLSVTWKDAAQAASWANDLAQRVNARLRGQALAEADRNIKYLQTEIAATNVPSLQQSLGKVLESEMQKLLMARGSDEYAFKIVDKAVEPRKRVAPQRVIVVLASVLGGLLLSVLYIFGRSAFRGKAGAAASMR